MAEYIKNIWDEIAVVMHPRIGCSLVDLGIVKDISLKHGTICITLALPFANIPIKDFLIESVLESIEEIEDPVKIQTVVMTKNELKKFLAVEKKNLKDYH